MILLFFYLGHVITFGMLMCHKHGGGTRIKLLQTSNHRHVPLRAAGLQRDTIHRIQSKLSVRNGFAFGTNPEGSVITTDLHTLIHSLKTNTSFDVPSLVG